MNLYGILAIILAIIIFAFAFDVADPIRELICRMTDIPGLDELGGNSALYKLGIRLAYLIVVVALIKIIFTRNSDE